MAITYDESAALMTNQAFIGRVKVSVLHFANYILNEPTATPAHNTRYKWAQYAIVNADAVATQVTPPTVMDAAVQSAGSMIDDASLQTAVENTINSMM